MKKGDVFGLSHVGSIVAILFLFGWMGLHSGSFPVLILAGFVNGIILCLSFFAFLHWTAHDTLFETRWLNRAFGRVFALSIMEHFFAYRCWHQLHHNFSISGADQMSKPYSDRFPNVRSKVTYLLEFMFYPLNFISRAYGYYDVLYRNKEMRRRYYEKYKVDFRLDMVLFALWISFLVWSSLKNPALMMGIYWTPFIVNKYLSFFLDMAEHQGTDPNGKTLFENTRSIDAGRILRFFAVNGNYHLEHHISPQAPYFSLMRVRKEIQDKILFRSSGYFSFNKAYFKSIPWF